MDIRFFIYLSMMIFIIGIIGVVTKRNPLILFLSIELILNAVNVLFVAFARLWENSLGHIWVFFILVVAAAEAAVGLAIIMSLFRSKRVVDIDQMNSLKG